MVSQIEAFLDSKGTIHKTKNSAVKAELSHLLGAVGGASHIITNRYTIIDLLSQIEDAEEPSHD